MIKHFPVKMLKSIPYTGYVTSFTKRLLIFDFATSNRVLYILSTTIRKSSWDNNIFSNYAHGLSIRAFKKVLFYFVWTALQMIVATDDNYEAFLMSLLNSLLKIQGVYVFYLLRIILCFIRQRPIEASRQKYCKKLGPNMTQSYKWLYSCLF